VFLCSYRSQDPKAMLIEGVVGRSLRAAERPTLIFDSDCGFCRGWVRRVVSWDRSQRLRYLPLQDPTAPELSGRKPEELGVAVHLVRPDGTVFAGAAAVREAFAYLPGGLIPRAVMTLPGVMPVAARAYAWIARAYGPVGNRSANGLR
jgi:predicted DCC family thiol-disulfide oxidoreductase YuxK